MTTDELKQLFQTIAITHKKRVLFLAFYTAVIDKEVFSLNVPQQFTVKAY